MESLKTWIYRLGIIQDDLINYVRKKGHPKKQQKETENEEKEYNKPIKKVRK